MEYEVELGTFTVRGNDLTTVSIGSTRWVCFVEICSKLLPFVNRASIHNRVNRSKARMVLADKSVVAALKRQEVITKHTGKVYLINVENIALVLSLFDENSSRYILPSHDSTLDEEDGPVDPGDDCGDKILDDDDDIGAEEVIGESGEAVNDGDGDGDGDENSEEDENENENGDGKMEESSQEQEQEQVSSSNVPIPGPGRGRRRCPDCSTIVKSNQPTCTQCGKRLFTPGRKRRGYPGAYARRMKRKRLEHKDPSEGDYDVLDESKLGAPDRPRRWRKWCGPCRAACSSNALACHRCGNTHLRESGHDQAVGGGVEEDQDGDDGDDLNDGVEEIMDTGHGDEVEVEDGTSKHKGGTRSKWCRHCSLYMPENCTECTECNRPVKRKYRRRCATIASRPSTAKRRAALVARTSSVSGQGRRADVDDGGAGTVDGEQAMGSGGSGGKWCSKCQKTAPPLVTHCLICGKELKRVYRKRSAIWQQNQQNQVQQQQERHQERRRAGIKGLAGVVGGCEVTGSDGQHLNWSQRFNLTSFIPDEEHTFVHGDGSRPVVIPDSVEIRGGRAMVRRAELKRHETYMPRNASEAVGLSNEQQPVLRRPIVDLPPRPTQGSEREKLHFAQCFLNIKMGLSQSELINVVSESRQRHQNSIDAAARSFEEVDSEWHATKERTTNLECQAKTLEKRLADLKQQLSAEKREVSRLNRLARQTEHQERLYGRVSQHFHKRLVACQSIIDGGGGGGGSTQQALSSIGDSSSSAAGKASGLSAVITETVAATTSYPAGVASSNSLAQGAAGTTLPSGGTAAAARSGASGPSVTTLTQPVNPAVAGMTPESWAQLQSQAVIQQLPARDHGCDVLQHSVAMVS